MAYLNKIDINGRTYYLQHLTDGKNEAMLPTMEKDSKIIIQDASTSGNVGDTDTPVYIKDNKVTAFNKSIGDAATPVYVKYGNIQPLSDDVGSTTNPIYMKAGAITASNETVGSGIVPIYMQDGVITSSTGIVGSNVKPMYLNNGTMTESDATVGSGIVPIYMNAGTITASTETVGSDIKPIYMDNGEITASNATVGSGIKPVYMQDGTITASGETVGSNIKLVYMYNGTITESNTNVGSEIIPVYMLDGEITQTTKTVGSGIKPIYMDGGAITAFASTIGAVNQPVYINNGEITVCSDNVGSAGVPVYMANGVITACDTIPISSGGTSAKTPEEALVNFGLTATAAELNTLDGITATVTELNYVDGVTSNIQVQFNDQDERIKTMETFFKEADIDASQEFIDTLKEIQTYIDDDKTGAAAMAASIQANKTSIETEAKAARAAEKANADAIAVLNGSDDGSVAKAVADAKTILEAKIAKKLDKTDAYVHPSYDGCSSGLYKITVDSLGHVVGVEAVIKQDILDLEIPGQDTTYGVAVAATETENGVDGLLSATDKAKYDKYESTIAELQKQIEELQKLVEGYHPVTEPDELEPDETE